MVKTLHFIAGGTGLISAQGTKIPRTARPTKTKTKQTKTFHGLSRKTDRKILKIPGWARQREWGFLTGEMTCCLMFLMSDPVLQESHLGSAQRSALHGAHVRPLLNTADPGIGSPEPPASQQVPGTHQPSPLHRLSLPFWTFSIHHQQETQLCHG